MMVSIRLAALAAGFSLLSLTAAPPARADGAASPFAFSAAVGPQAASRIDALVTRSVGGASLTLPAAAVPALRPGDVVSLRFPDYTRPPAETNYHVDVGFITERPPVAWLFGKSGPWDGLFAPPHERRGTAGPVHEIRFTYGAGNHQGIPIVFIVPEDRKTRGMNGVRDYVDAHPTDFKDMSVSANEAVARYSWFNDFLNSLAQGALDPDAQQRVVAIATSLGASPTAVQACYVAGSTSSQIANCVQSTLVSVQYQTNIEAPTQAQFFGGIASAASPTQLALYLEPLLAIWKIFSRAGHTEYEYLPTTLHLLDPATAAAGSTQMLMGLKVPTLRPPGATSSALFFTIGDPAAVAHPPSVIDDDPGTGVCVRSDRVPSPLHLDATSQYVNGTALLVQDASGGTARLPIDPATAAAPLLDRSRLAPGHGYDLHLTGRFGFTTLLQSQRLGAHLAVPGAAQWQIASVPDRSAVAGGSLDVIAASPTAPCLSGAELQLAGNAPVPLKVEHLDADHVELTGSLSGVPAGVATVRLDEDDAAHGRLVAGTATLAIAGPPATIDPASNPTAFLGDRSILLAGRGLDAIADVRVANGVYTKAPGSRGDVACFVGPPLAGAIAGTTTTAQLLTAGGNSGEAFPLQIDGARPVLAAVSETPPGSLHLSTERIGITLSSGASPLPRTFSVRLRRAPVQHSPCEGLSGDKAAGLVPAAATYRRSSSEIALTLRAGDVLPGDAFGTLQVRLIDTATGVGSDWVDLPGSFARAPIVTNVFCPGDPAAGCTLWGTDLDAIAAVTSPDGSAAPPGYDCTPTDKLECRSIPRLAHYALRLRDAAVTIQIPDSALTAAKAPVPAPS